MQRNLGPIQHLGQDHIHMGHLAALLAGVQAGAGCFEPRPVGGQRCQSVNRWRGTRIQPQPGVADGAVLVTYQPRVPSPCAVTEMAAVRGQGLQPCLPARAGQRAVFPGLAKRLNR